MLVVFLSFLFFLISQIFFLVVLPMELSEKEEICSFLTTSHTGTRAGRGRVKTRLAKRKSRVETIVKGSF